MLGVTRLRELAERKKQGYPKGDVPFPPEADSDYIEIKWGLWQRCHGPDFQAFRKAQKLISQKISWSSEESIIVC